MRNYSEMIEWILSIARKDDRVRTVVMNGSRVINAQKDEFQDYDIVFFVEEYTSMIDNREWLKAFGNPMMTHTSDDMIFHPGKMDDGFMFQMLFYDKNRIDLLIRPLYVLETHLKEDAYHKVLLDKDSLYRNPHGPSNAHFSIGKPSYELFKSCVREILWVAPYIAKGLCRGERLYALEHLGHIRENTKALLRWYVGCAYGFETVLKKASDDLPLYLDTPTWKSFLSTYVLPEKRAIWKALFEILKLTETYGPSIAKKLNYNDNLDALEALKHYLEELKSKC